MKLIFVLPAIWWSSGSTIATSFWPLTTDDLFKCVCAAAAAADLHASEGVAGFAGGKNAGKGKVAGGGGGAGSQDGSLDKTAAIHIGFHRVELKG